MDWGNIWHRLSLRLGSLRSCATGAAAAEFAIILPVMGILVSGTMDLAHMANQGLVLDAAVRAGAAYAVSDSTNPTAIKCIIGDPSVTCPAGVNRYATFATGVTVTVTFLNQDANVLVQPQFCTMDNSTTATSCDNIANPCSALPNQCPKHSYIRIQAVETGLNPILKFTGFPTTVTRTLTVRVA